MLKKFLLVLRRNLLITIYRNNNYVCSLKVNELLKDDNYAHIMSASILSFENIRFDGKIEEIEINIE